MLSAKFYLNHNDCSRKRKAGKLDMYRTEALPPRIPVIMQDELSEDNFNVSKQPIILRWEGMVEFWRNVGKTDNLIFQGGTGELQQLRPTSKLLREQQDGRGVL